jgi:cation-transporting ATPase E
MDPSIGLTSAEVAERMAKGQVNAVPSGTSRSYAQIARANILTRFNAILGTMLVLILLVGPLQDALFGIVLVLNSAIGIFQEVRAKRKLDRLALLSAPRARVVRDGRFQEIAFAEVVLDDVVHVGLGDQVVADGIVVRSDGLQLDESLLTGESEPVTKQVGDEVMSGSFAVAGAGSFRATRVGASSYAAGISADARRFSLVRSELRDGINRILRYVTWVIIPTAALLFWSQVKAAGGWMRAVSGAVAGTVAMVPEGLVLLTSIAFAVAVTRLAERRVLVQELPAVEGLARVDIVCIDKTGTLTEGSMQVEGIFAEEDRKHEVRDALAALAGNDPAPNATSLAIAQRCGAAPKDWRPEGVVAFSSSRKWSAMQFQGRGAWVLGGPDVLLAADASNGADRETRDEADRLASQGKRVVILAKAPALDGEDLPQAMIPVATVSLSQRIRPSARATLSYFAEQDVSVKVISGDDPTTVGAVASQLGLPGSDVPVDSRKLPSGTALGEAMETHSVFGRVTPQQKRDMVLALQSRGHTVAMTGDGVNDALALKAADLGVAMGSGSEATRAVARIVLLDSNFDALPSLVAEGRRVLANIENTSSLYLTKTFYAMILAIVTGVSAIAGHALAFPFLPRHMTLVAALTIGIPSFFLALAPNATLFRPGFVGRVIRFAAPAGVLAGVATMLGYAIARNEAGLTLAQQRTTATMTLTWVGLAVLTVVASPLNRWKLTLIWSMAVAFILALLLPFTREFFGLEAPPLIVWLAAIGEATLVWSLARLFVPGERPIGPRSPRDLAAG